MYNLYCQNGCIYLLLILIEANWEDIKAQKQQQAKLVGEVICCKKYYLCNIIFLQ